jgi:tetratricopeptide (TPR) repeat protein
LIEENKMKIARVTRSALPIIAIFFAVSALTIPVRAGGLTLPPEATQAMAQMYEGDPDGAVATAQKLQLSQPDHPLGFILEAEAEWSKTFCASSEIKYGMVDAWKRGKKPEDEAYFALADKAIELAQAQIARSETAEMHLYAGAGYALKARLFGLRGEHRAVAHAGVSARSEFLRALELDPDMADATAGIGLYNYYVDSLSSIVKMLSVFMGIPGGNKQEGIRQMQIGMDRGVLFSVDTRFYLAKNLRKYDQQYEQALTVGEPLVARYPNNPVYLLLLGNLNAELSRNDKAAEYFHAVLKLPAIQSACEAPPSVSASNCMPCFVRARDIANSFLASLP